jgi:DNA transformation protein and related proteins
MDGLSDFGSVEVRRFFGGWSLRHQGVQFAMVIGDQLYFSVEGALREELIALGSEPFTYGKDGRTTIVGKYQTAPLSCLEDPDELRQWVNRIVMH